MLIYIVQPCSTVLLRGRRIFVHIVFPREWHNLLLYNQINNLVRISKILFDFNIHVKYTGASNIKRI
jgi:hypothetical protein